MFQTGLNPTPSSTRLHVTPPEALTQRTPNWRAVRTVFVTSTSTIAAGTPAHRSRRQF